MTTSLRLFGSCLDLETLGPSATTSLLELAALAGNAWLLSRVRTETEMLDGFTGVLGSTEEEGVGTSWGALLEHEKKNVSVQMISLFLCLLF